MPRLLLLVLLLVACGAPEPVSTTQPALDDPFAPPRRAPVQTGPQVGVTIDAPSKPPSMASAIETPSEEAQRAESQRPTLANEPLHPELLERCDAPRRIVVHKAARRLDLRCGDELAARYEVGLGFAPLGDKHHEGDVRTPEGEYYITSKFVSSFHRSLQLSYPNVADADRGLAERQINNRQHAAIVRANAACTLPPQTTELGSWLQIHGGGGGADWTLGCVAIANDAIDAASAFHRPGCRGGVPRTRVIIRP